MSPEGVGNDNVPHSGQNIGRTNTLIISIFVMYLGQLFHQGGSAGLPYVAMV